MDPREKKIQEIPSGIRKAGPVYKSPLIERRYYHQRLKKYKNLWPLESADQTVQINFWNEEIEFSNEWHFS